MGSFEAFGLFDPDEQDEELNENIFLSASELLEKKRKKGGSEMIPRSNTELNLKRSNTAVPRSSTCLDLKKTVREGEGVKEVGRSRTFSAPVDDDYTYLPPEPQMGNIECDSFSDKVGHQWTLFEKNEKSSLFCRYQYFSWLNIKLRC